MTRGLFAFMEPFARNLKSSAARQSLPRYALNLPEKPRTCPQNLSPKTGELFCR